MDFLNLFLLIPNIMTVNYVSVYVSDLMTYIQTIIFDSKKWFLRKKFAKIII